MSDEPTASPDPAATKRTRLIVAAVVIALVVVGGIVWLVSRGGSEDKNTSSAPGTSASPSPSPTYATRSPSTTKKKKKTVPPYTGPANTRKPQRVAFQSTGRPGKGLAVSIAKVEPITAKAVTIGDVGGPALRITVAVHNQGTKAVPIYAALTNLYYGPKRTPADPAHEPGGKPFPPSVGPGRTVNGVVIYTISKANRSNLDLEVNLDNRLRTLEFSGSCPQDC